MSDVILQFLVPIRIPRGAKPQDDVGQETTTKTKETQEEGYANEEWIDLEILGNATTHASNLLVLL